MFVVSTTTSLRLHHGKEFDLGYGGIIEGLFLERLC